MTDDKNRTVNKNGKPSVDSIMLNTTFQTTQMVFDVLEDCELRDRNWIIERTGLKRTNTYHALRRLMRLGIVSERVERIVGRGRPITFFYRIKENEKVILTEVLGTGHPSEKPYKCGYNGCNKAFVRLLQLTDHERTHSGEKPYKCGYNGCNKAFARSSQRVYHLLSHTNEYDFECDCGAAFRIASELTVHKLVEACSFYGRKPRQWEFLVQIGLKMIYPNGKFPKTIKTPDLQDRRDIRPDFFVPTQQKGIIYDAKTSIRATTKKDIEVYPQYADKVILVYLYGEKKFTNPKIECMTSNQFVELLDEARTDENSDKLNGIIAKIRLMQNGKILENILDKADEVEA